MNPNNPIFVLLLIAHATSAILGFGSISLSGYYVRTLDKRDVDSVRFFSSQRLGPKILIALAFIFGLGLILLSSDATVLLDSLWLRLGIVAYIAATITALGMVWPAEAKIRRALGGDTSARDLSLGQTIKRVYLGSLLVDFLLTTALILMVTQPG